MKTLAGIINNTEHKLISGDENTLISEVVYDTRKISHGCIFICIKGAKFDSHAAIKEALAMGAAAVVVEEDNEYTRMILSNLSENSGCLSDMALVVVPDTRLAMAEISAAWFDYPARKIKTIGITGTKGKTTITYLIKSILEKAGFKVGLVGTIEIITGSRTIPSVNTTPESYLLQQYFAEMWENGVDVVVMEVSSQGIMMHRTAGIEFDYGVFTNLSPDHIGPNEHGSFEEYLGYKSKLFRQCKVGIFNGDDKYLNDILEGHTCQVETFGFGKNNDLVASNEQLVYKPGYLGVSFDASGVLDMKVTAGIPGKFSVYNVLTALSVCRHFDIKMDVLENAFLEAKVKGRIELVKLTDDMFIIIDYAHNAMALESVLTALREYKPERLVCLFGCGGNRAKSRRYEMGEVSGRMADLTIITSDNPREEEPLDIIVDIVSGIERTDGEFVKIPDRKAAIEYAIAHGQKGDLIVLAGKGHEDYQEIKGVKYPMDERVIIQEILDSGVVPGALACMPE